MSWNLLVYATIKTLHVNFYINYTQPITCSYTTPSYLARMTDGHRLLGPKFKSQLTYI